MRKIVVSIGGSSGAIYGKRLLDHLRLIADQYEEVSVIVSDNAIINWKIEMGEEALEHLDPFKVYRNNDFMAPFASGSAKYDTMIVCPCSMGFLGRVAHGISNDLSTRAADVMLKESRTLVLVPRETPYSMIHINNMKLVIQAGAILCPANPSFYLKPKSVFEVVDTVVERVLDLAGFDIEGKRWGDSPE